LTKLRKTVTIKVNKKARIIAKKTFRKEDKI